MKTALFVVAIFVAAQNSCRVGKLFSKKTPHERYESFIKKNELDETPEGRAWLAASSGAMTHPQLVSVPYNQRGVFKTDKPRALALLFPAKRGQQLIFNLSKEDTSSFVIYADLFQQIDSANNRHRYSADTLSREFVYTVEETGTYLLRLQPALFQGGEYDLTLTTGPSMGFPVAGKQGRIRSFWGADRDAGARKHEGIDIFAPKLTAAVAATNGTVTGVNTGGIGGKTVWLSANDQPVHLYYAHLDQQLVTEGQRVRIGDTIGLIGNTGNAQFTPAHLHFGVYTSRGAIDPLPFVNRVVPRTVQLKQRILPDALKLKKTHRKNVGVDTIASNITLVPLAYNGNGFICELPDGKIIQAPFKSVVPVRTHRE